MYIWTYKHTEAQIDLSASRGGSVDTDRPTNERKRT